MQITSIDLGRRGRKHSVKEKSADAYGRVVSLPFGVGSTRVPDLFLCVEER